ncbi:MAG: hypothetical protein FWE29_05600 [Defluviitaleaceae bacterium]|nr:hypothetical protein [Defluviitaleaceae bacterium]
MKASFVLTFTAFLLTACAWVLPEYEHGALEGGYEVLSLNEETNVVTPLIFIPEGERFAITFDDFLLILTRIGLTWEISEEIQPRLPRPNPSGTSAAYAISNHDDTITCIIFMLHTGARGDRAGDLSMSFHFNPQATEDALVFIQEELPLFWILAGEIFQAQEELIVLSNQVSEYFQDYIHLESPLDKSHTGIAASWSGREGNIFVEVGFLWNPLLELYVPLNIDFSTRPSFPYD